MNYVVHFQQENTFYQRRIIFLVRRNALSNPWGLIAGWRFTCAMEGKQNQTFTLACHQSLVHRHLLVAQAAGGD